MVFETFIRSDEVAEQGRCYTVRYFEGVTPRGAHRYSAEVMLGPADRIILDAASMIDLELRVARLVPATLQSRMLVTKTPAA